MQVVPCVVVIFGVSGCGKSTVGAMLSQRLGWLFLEGDNFHPPSNIEKMTSGTPLTDADRLPWLQQLAAIIAQRCASRRPAVLSCSALKPLYRQLLRGDAPLAVAPVTCLEGLPLWGPSQGPSTQGEFQGHWEGPSRGWGLTPGQPCWESCEGSQRVPGGTHESLLQAPAMEQCGPGSGGRSAQEGEEREEAVPGVAFVLLEPSRQQLQGWVEARSAKGGHFMPPSLLDSQLATLQYSEGEELYCRITGEPFPSPLDIVEKLAAALQPRGNLEGGGC